MVDRESALVARMKKALATVGVALSLVACSGDPGLELAKETLCRPFQRDDEPRRPDPEELLADLGHAAMLLEDRGERELASVARALEKSIQDRPYPLLTVYLLSEADDDDVATLREDLVRTDHVVGVEYVSQQEAFEEFKEHYRDQPEFWESLDADALPAELLVQVDDAGALPELIADLEDESVVDETRYSESPGGGLELLGRMEQEAVLRLCAPAFFGER